MPPRSRNCASTWTEQKPTKPPHPRHRNKSSIFHSLVRVPSPPATTKRNHCKAGHLVFEKPAAGKQPSTETKSSLSARERGSALRTAQSSRRPSAIRRALTIRRKPFRVNVLANFDRFRRTPFRGASVAGKAWSGVFQEATDRRVEQFSESISFDRRLYAHDIQGSIAHAQMLATTGLLTADECQQIEQALEAIRQEIEQGQFEFTDRTRRHSSAHRAGLIDKLGDIGRKLHTARSRNDQIATDLRLWQREAIDRIDARLAGTPAGIRRPHRSKTPIASCPAIRICNGPSPCWPITIGLPIARNSGATASGWRIVRRRTNVLPLGSAALAGTSLPIDRQDVARRSKFESVSANSLDATSDRDFVLEFAFALEPDRAASRAPGRRSGFCGRRANSDFLKLPQAFCTGSSIMPQKVNPDVLELIRGKTARVAGNLQSLMMLLKGLPLAYNRDLQEDKPRLFDSFDTVDTCLELAAPLVAAAELNRAVIAERLDRGHLDATTLMEEMIRRGLPQRTAHEVVGRLVAQGARSGPAALRSGGGRIRRGPSRTGCERQGRAGGRAGDCPVYRLWLDRPGRGRAASRQLERKTEGVRRGRGADDGSPQATTSRPTHEDADTMMHTFRTLLTIVAACAALALSSAEPAPPRPRRPLPPLGTKLRRHPPLDRPPQPARPVDPHGAGLSSVRSGRRDDPGVAAEDAAGRAPSGCFRSRMLDRADLAKQFLDRLLSAKTDACRAGRSRAVCRQRHTAANGRQSRPSIRSADFGRSDLSLRRTPNATIPPKSPRS